MRSKRDRRARSLARAIRSGDVAKVSDLLSADPALATDRIGDRASSRTALHLATDWPANFPRVTETIALLITAGAPVDGRFAGPHEETALHWAASADDVAAIDALLAAGADIDAPGAVLTGGTPLSDAVIFEQWTAARRLVERGATQTLWQASALGNLGIVETEIERSQPPNDELDNACWHACRTGEFDVVKRLVAAGANVDAVGHDDLSGRQLAERSGNADLIAWLPKR